MHDGRAPDQEQSAAAAPAGAVPLVANAPDEEPVLCEGCGYALAGLPVNSVCPECSRSIATSVPAHRTGAAWQTRGWWAGLWAFVQHPIVQTRSLRCGIGDWLQLLINLALAAVMYTAALIPLFHLLVLLGDVEYNSGVAESPLAIALGVFVWWALAMVLAVGALVFVCVIEVLGLCTIAHAHRWRLNAPGARLLVTHASYGWVLGGVAYWFMLLLIAAMKLAYLRTIDSFVWATYFSFLGPLFGLIWFEAVVYFALRANRFANWGAAPRAAAPDATARSV